MKKSLVLFTLVLITAVVWTQPKHTIYDQVRKPEGTEYYHVPIALCED